MNYVERAECLLDTGGSGNMNFTIIAVYRGLLTLEQLQTALGSTQGAHQLLRTALHWSQGDCCFRETDARVPVRRLALTEFSQWQEVARQDVRQRFEDPRLPLWRVSWLDGAEHGQILLTFHHAIADGVCGMHLVDHLFSALALQNNTQTSVTQQFAPPENFLDCLDTLTTQEPEAEREPPERADMNYHTDYILDEIDATDFANVIAWSKRQGVRLNSVLFATLLMAIRRVTKSRYPIWMPVPLSISGLF